VQLSAVRDGRHPIGTFRNDGPQELKNEPGRDGGSRPEFNPRILLRGLGGLGGGRFRPASPEVGVGPSLVP
jgi:hypothetical protein